MSQKVTVPAPSAYAPCSSIFRDGLKFAAHSGTSLPIHSLNPLYSPGIMACRHHDAGVFFRWSTGKIQTGRGAGAKVDDIQTGGTQTSDQRAVKGRGGQAAVPGDDNRRWSLVDRRLSVGEDVCRMLCRSSRQRLHRIPGRPLP